MSNRQPIYAASQGDAAEVRRALRICLAGTQPPPSLTFRGGKFEDWSAAVFFPVLAPHTIRAYSMARCGDAPGLTAADRALSLAPSSAGAGRALLTVRNGAKHSPVLRRFAEAVREGKAPGNFATVLALQAADFSVALLPLLQCLLYCEWQAGFSGSPRGLEDFFHHTQGIFPPLSALLSTHAQNSDIPVARAL